MAKASEKFHGVEKYNCAQAVLKFFEDHAAVSPEKIEEFKLFGGGRAPDGVCGAIYAAEHILNDRTLIDELKETFKREAGSHCCREIKAAGRLSCAGCVDLAADLCAEKIKK
ncbi:MAG: C-GCAxxG-C-C family (seleno)protein [Victivallaceae bacterium]|jgi:hypothetical protein